MNKFIKILIIINGLIIPSLIVFNLFKKYDRDSKHETQGIIVGEKIDEAMAKNVEIQGLHYYSLRSILNSNSQYLPVSVNTYKEAMALEKVISSANNISGSTRKVTNILFMDSTLNETHWLLNKKGLIHEWEIRSESYFEEKKENYTHYKHLLFEIGFEDNNNDGLIDSEDYSDLYISDLNGKNLLQITENMDIVRYEFEDDYNTIFIEYTLRNPAIKKEHKLVKFGQYNIATKEFTSFHNLNKALKEYRESINKN